MAPNPSLRLPRYLAITIAVVLLALAQNAFATNTFSQLGYGYNVITGGSATHALMDTTKNATTAAAAAEISYRYQGTTYPKPAFMTTFADITTNCTLTPTTTISRTFGDFSLAANAQMSQQWRNSTQYFAEAKTLLEHAIPEAKGPRSISMWGTANPGDVVGMIALNTKTTEYDFYSTTLQCSLSSLTPRTIDPPLSTDFLTTLSTLPTYHVPRYGFGVYSNIAKPLDETRVIQH